MGKRVFSEEKFSIQLNGEQKEAKAAILNHPFSIIHGKAGTGKTIVPCQIGIKALLEREIERIIITRPTVSTEDNGFLPGTEYEKLEPWVVPIKDNMFKVYKNEEWLKKMEQDKRIEIVALSYFRGRTFDDAICIVDEYQNLNEEQFKMCIGRLGKNSIMIFTGDPKQIDLKNKRESAVHCVNKILASKYVYETTLTVNHRHDAVSELLDLLNGE